MGFNSAFKGLKSQVAVRNIVFMDVKSRGGFGLMRFVHFWPKNLYVTWECVLVRSM